MSTVDAPAAGEGRLLGEALLSQRQAEDLNLKLAEGADDSGGLILIPSSDPRGIPAGVVTRKIAIGNPPPALSASVAGRGAALMSMGGAPRQPAATAPAAGRAAPGAFKPTNAQPSRKRQDDDTSTSRAASAGAPPKRPKTSGAKARESGLGAFEQRECAAILETLLLNPKSYYFREPVDRAQLPDYFLVVDTPMDLGTVKRRLEGGEYERLDDFEEDVRQVWINCRMYNREGTDAFKKGEDLSALFERKASALRAKLEARAAAGGGGGGGGSGQRRASSKGGVLDQMQQMQQMMMAAAAMNPMLAMMMNPVMQQQMQQAGGGTMAGALADNPMLAQMQQMQQMMAAGGMGGMMGGMGACMGMLPGMAAGGAQQPAAADTNGSGAAHGGKGARAGAGRGPNEEMSYAIKATLSQQIGKLKGGQMSKVIDIMKRDPGFAAHAAGGADGEALKLDLDALQDGTLWKLNDYVTAAKGVNARKKVAPISKSEQLGMARAKSDAHKHKVAQLHGGVPFGSQPFVQPVLPRPQVLAAGPRSASQGGSRKAPGFSMPAPSMPSKSASIGGQPKGGADDSSSESSDGGRPVAAPTSLGARPKLGASGGLPAALGRPAVPRPAGASSGGTGGGLLGKGGSGINPAWANFARPAAPAAGAGSSRIWEQAAAARQSALALKEQASQGQAAAQREREAAAARQLEAATLERQQQEAAQRDEERKAREQRDAARAAARAEREKLAGALAPEPASNGGYNFDDFNNQPGQLVE